MWTNPSHLIVKLFVVATICTIYILFPTRTQPCFKFMKFHVFVLLALIGVQRRDAKMNFMSIMDIEKAQTLQQFGG